MGDVEFVRERVDILIDKQFKALLKKFPLLELKITKKNIPGSRFRNIIFFKDKLDDFTNIESELWDAIVNMAKVYPELAQKKFDLYFRNNHKDVEFLKEVSELIGRLGKGGCFTYILLPYGDVYGIFTKEGRFAICVSHGRKHEFWQSIDCFREMLEKYPSVTYLSENNIKTLFNGRRLKLNINNGLSGISMKVKWRGGSELFEAQSVAELFNEIELFSKISNVKNLRYEVSRDVAVEMVRSKLRLKKVGYEHSTTVPTF